MTSLPLTYQTEAALEQMARRTPRTSCGQLTMVTAQNRTLDVGSFAVDGKVAGLVDGVDALASLEIELDQPDVAEIGAVNQPQPAAVGIAKDTRINRVAVFNAVR